MEPAKVKEIITEGITHLHFMIKLYWKQLNAGTHFVHEHPRSARSWADDVMQELLADERVGTTVSDQCEYGLVTPGPNGEPIPAKKPTQWASSSPRMLARLSKRCTGTHEHQHLEGQRTQGAELYPLP